ncbi:MAG: iron-containing alcohol dehydrogenase [Acidobacteria bacterium]|nr:iron-containing alcohol dehydrogenase [Acidobacteriota bacterium]MCA1652012.1 iron-containing alcohol dehydrogenase [Acidobacteriota bacterium]
MVPFEFQPRTRVIFGQGSSERTGTVARDLGFRRTLLVADAGLVETGHVASVVRSLDAAGIAALPFHEFGVNPDSAMMENGRAFAAGLEVDSIIGVGGGSSLDAAKGINFLLTNGGVIADYRGYGKATTPLLPMIGIPTTAGTGSEAQSYAVLSDAATHVKMACGDPSGAFRVAILDPVLTRTAPRAVTAMAGFDAIAHAVETAVTVKRTALSAAFSQQSWRLLSDNFARVLAHPEDLEARAAMQLGAHFAGMAIEQSMLGAAHACANPLTARFGLTHGLALAILLPHVVRWNGTVAGDLYGALIGVNERDACETLARWLEGLRAAGDLPTRLAGSGVDAGALPDLARDAAAQWTGTFNPRPFDETGALEIYRAAM